jgi:hypothetical protein
MTQMITNQKEIKNRKSISICLLFSCSSFCYSWSFVFVRGLLLSFLLVAGTGCLLNKPSLTPMATDVPTEQATPDYWWNRPGVAAVSNPDFEKLWSACKFEMYIRLFRVDREDYREGLLTSDPVISKQIFEPWRTDAISLQDQAESSLATIRRTVHFEVTKQADGTYQVTPKVLIERFASAERRLTAITQYHEAFSGPRAYNDAPDQSGEPAAADYWYALRRDTDLEKAMAASIRHQLAE